MVTSTISRTGPFSRRPGIPSGFSLNQASDLAFLGLRRRHELADRLQNDLKLRVVFLFQRRKLPGELFVGSEHSTQTDEGSHDLDIDADGALAPNDTGEHRHGLLRKNIRQ